MIPLQLGFCKLKKSTTNNLLVLEFNINPFFITTSRVDLISYNRELASPDSRFEPSNCNTMRQMASPMLSVPLVLDDCCTWRSHSSSSAEREGTTISRRGRAASEGRGRRCNRAAGNRQPPFHAFLHLHTCAFSLNSSACFLWQVTASMRRREGQARRQKRPRYTKPATHGRLLASFLTSICTPIDL